MLLFFELSGVRFVQRHMPRSEGNQRDTCQGVIGAEFAAATECAPHEYRHGCGHADLRSGALRLERGLGFP